MAKVSDKGWHVIAGYIVYVEDGKVQKGIDPVKMKVIYPYKHTNWGRATRVKVKADTFREGINRGTYFMREAYV